MRYYKSHMAQFFGGSRPGWAGPFFNADDGGGGGEGTAGESSGTESEPGEPNKPAEPDPGDEGGEGGEGSKPDEGKPDESKPDEALTPESFALPEGYKFQEDDAKTFTDILSDKSLSDKDRAQKFVDLHCKVLGDFAAGIDAGGKAAAEAMAKSNADEEAGWLDTCKADPDIGGHNWERSQAQMERVVRELKLDGLHTLMAGMGMANHPDYFKSIVGLHGLVGEDKAGGGKASGMRKSDEEVFYPDRGEDN